jgi:uncharacterized circularly permuted ATP-grasp superfamily protein
MKDISGGVLSDYRNLSGMLDEVFGKGEITNLHYQKIIELFGQYSAQDFRKLDRKARRSFLQQGVTYSVTNELGQGTERIFPFDLLPRIIPASEWETLERGVIQRNLAINAFLYDLYHQQHIFKEGIVPRELVLSSKHYCSAMEGLDPTGGIYNHISGTDVIRHSDGSYYVLEDNVRTPSGISYVLANRDAMKHTLFSCFHDLNVNPLHEYTDHLFSMLLSVASGSKGRKPCCAVLTDGMIASAYFEHAFLAHSMGIPLLEGKDLYVENKKVYMKTIRGPQQVDVLYRRVDDEFLDPLAFKPDSIYGVPGIMEAYRQGNITLINAPGTGVADDKAVYSYVPAMIRYYLNEEPLLNNVPTFHCTIDQDYQYVMENMEKLVIKPVDEFGGFGILIGSAASKEELSHFKKLIAANRRKYIAQPIMNLSTHPTYIDEKNKFEPRHIDLRIYALLGKDIQYVLKGGLTRVALTEGKLIVNSHQGGGSKDTWVLSAANAPVEAKTPKTRDRAAIERTAVELQPSELTGKDRNQRPKPFF